MRKVLFFLVKFLIVFSCILCLGSLIIDINDYKKHINDFIQNKYHLTLNQDYKIDITVFPLPHFKIKDIEVSDQEKYILYSGDVSVYPSYKIFFFHKNADWLYKVEFSNATLDLQHIAALMQNNITPNGLLTKINMIDSTISFGSKCNSCLLVKNLSYSSQLFKSNYTLNANITSEDKEYKIQAAFSNITPNGLINDVVLSIEEQLFIFKLTGTAQNIFVDPQFQGNAAASIKNVKELMYYNIKNFGISNTNDLNLNLFQEKKIDFTADAVLKNDSMTFINIASPDPNIENFQGIIELTIFDGKIEWYVNFNATKINFDNLLVATKNKNLQSLLDLLTADRAKSLSQSLHSSYFNVIIDQLQIFHDDIKDIVIRGHTKDKRLFLGEFSCSFPGDGTAEVVGYYDENQYGDKSEGDITIKIKSPKETILWLYDLEDTSFKAWNEFLLKSDFITWNNKISFRNIIASFDAAQLKGQIDFSETAGRQKRIDSSLIFNQLDLDKLTLSKMLDRDIILSFKADGDKTGKAYYKAVRDYKWLRYLSYTVNIDITAEMAVLKNQELQNFATSIRLAPSHFTLQNIKFDHPNAKLNQGMISLHVNSLKPVFNTSFDFDYVSAGFLNDILPNMPTLDDKHQKNNNLNFFSLYNFNGDLSFYAKKFTSADNCCNMDNIAIEVALNQGLLELNKGTFNYGTGMVSIVGNVTAIEKLPQINVNFVLNDVDPKCIYKALTGQEKISGHMSMSGHINSRGNTISDVFANQSGEIQVIAKALQWNGFDLNEIVKVTTINASIEDKISRLNYYKQYGYTTFDRIEGKINIKNNTAYLQNFTLAHQFATGSLAAIYDINKRIINSASKYSFIPFLNSAPIVLQFKSSGNLSNPDLVIDDAQVLTTIKQYIPQSSN